MRDRLFIVYGMFRYVAVAYPLRVERLFRPKRVLLFVVLAWWSTALWYVPIWYGLHWCENSGKSNTWPKKPRTE